MNLSDICPTKILMNSAATYMVRLMGCIMGMIY